MKLTRTTPTAAAWLVVVACTSFSSSSSSFFFGGVAAETFDIEWFIPGSGGSLPDVTVKVGDTLNFVWSGTHNVYIHPNQDCSLDGSTEVGGTSPATYEITDANVPAVYFACQIGPHCSLGQHVLVTVQEAQVMETPSPTEQSIAIADPPPGSNVTLPDTDTGSMMTPAPSVEVTEGIGAPNAGDVVAPTEAPMMEDGTAPVMAPVAVAAASGGSGSRTVLCQMSGLVATLWFLAAVA
jgi:plastocyanin